MRLLTRYLKDQGLRALRRMGYRLERVEPGGLSLLEKMLEALIPPGLEFFFVQIGANDGRTCDPLHAFLERRRSMASGIMVEPLRDKYEALAQTCQAFDRIIRINRAIHNSERQMTLYRVDPMAERYLPAWAKGIASFDPEHHLRCGIPRRWIRAEEVTCVTMAELLSEFRVAQVDILVTDTEGYDYEILRQFDFVKFRPRVIQFEHGVQNGVMSGRQFSEVTRLLQWSGYAVMTEGQDAVAFRPDDSEGAR